MVLARDVVGFETRGPVRAVLLDGSGEIEARALIVATGVSYRRLEAAGLDELTGRGVYYGANASEASQCQGDDVYIVGAANSAGQAALNLSRFAKRVVLVVRARRSWTRCRSTCRPDHVGAQHRGALPQRGGGRPGRRPPRGADPRRPDSGATEEVPASWLFVFIGASPRTEWLGPDVVRDDKGFVVTGQDLRSATPAPALAAGAGAVRAGDERARRVRRRRRPARLDEAGRVRRR